MRWAPATGSRCMESGIDIKHLVHSGCRHAPDSAPIALQRTADAPTALHVRVRAERGLPLSCWAQTAPFDVELADDKVALYFKEIQAPPAVRDAWARMRARGVTWKERYTKHARIELDPGAERRHAGEHGDGRAARRRRSARRAAASRWRFRCCATASRWPTSPSSCAATASRSASGARPMPRAACASPRRWPGRWVLRGTDLRLCEREPDTWESRFVTLAFEIAPTTTAAEASGGAATTGRTRARRARPPRRRDQHRAADHHRRR